MKNMPFSFTQTLNRKLFVLLLIVSTFLSSCSSDTSYLEGMPTAENANNLLKTKISAKDSLTSYAKRIGALRQLSNIIIKVIAFDRNLTEKERLLSSDYKMLANNIETNYLNSIESENEKKEFKEACYKWEEDGYLEDLVLNSIISPNAKQLFNTQYDKIKNKTETDKTRNKTKGIIYLIIGFGLFVSWFLIGTMLGKEKFNRTNQHGVQEFKNYNSLLKSELSTGCLSWVAYGLLFLGLGFFIYGIILLTQ
jgi:outer membrane biogenesis lipoprotein LolB